MRIAMNAGGALKRPKTPFGFIRLAFTATSAVAMRSPFARIVAINFTWSARIAMNITTKLVVRNWKMANGSVTYAVAKQIGVRFGKSYSESKLNS